jgi:hypothetical protein
LPQDLPEVQKPKGSVVKKIAKAIVWAAIGRRHAMSGQVPRRTTSRDNSRNPNEFGARVTARRDLAAGDIALLITVVPPKRKLFAVVNPAMTDDELGCAVRGLFAVYAETDANLP